MKRILCPTDFSAFSMRALEHAIAICKWYGAELDILHVMPSLSTSGLGLPVAVPVPKNANEDVLAELEAFAEPARKVRVQVRTFLLEGDPVVAILDRAEKRASDLIILGTHGARGFERWVLGSVTERVLRKARCPVMTVPRGETEAPGEVFSETILCAMDFSACSAYALEQARALARDAGAHVVALHVLDWLAPDPTVDSESRRREHPIYVEGAVLERLRKFIPVRANLPDPEPLVRGGRPHTEILRTSRQRGAGLIVMGVESRGTFDLMLYGSTTQHVIREATCPVLTVRRPEPAEIARVCEESFAAV